MVSAQQRVFVNELTTTIVFPFSYSYIKNKLKQMVVVGLIFFFVILFGVVRCLFCKLKSLCLGKMLIIYIFLIALGNQEMFNGVCFLYLTLDAFFSQLCIRLTCCGVCVSVCVCVCVCVCECV